MDDRIKRFLKIHVSYIDRVPEIEFDSPIINTFQQLRTGRVLGQEPVLLLGDKVVLQKLGD